MIKLLLKHRIKNFFAQLTTDSKKGKKRSKIGVTFIFFALILAFISAAILGFGASYFFCEPLVSVGLSWVYFAITGLLATAIGIIGSVFASYSAIYAAKDNDLLLSMPIKPRDILFVRMLGCYLVSLLFESTFTVPAFAVYFWLIGWNVKVLILAVASLFILPLFALALSCLLAWIIAMIVPHVKHKSIVGVVMSLAFLTAYYVIYFNASTIFSSLLTNGGKIGSFFETFLYPIAALGKGLAGDTLQYLIFVAVAIVLMALVYALLSKNFIKLATAKGKSAKVKYKRQAMGKSHGIDALLLKKEFLRFKSSAAYMLNTAMGTLLMVAGGIFLLIKRDDVREILAFIPDKGAMYLICVGMLFLLTSMNDITAPSVSLEGESIWVTQMLPVHPFRVLRAKIMMHLILTAPSALFLSFCLCITANVKGIFMLLIPISALVFTAFGALFGLTLGVMKPNIHYSSENAAVKQGIAVVAAVFGSWAIVAVLGIAYYLLIDVVPPEVYLLISLAILTGAAVRFYYWLKTRGAERFSKLV